MQRYVIEREIPGIGAMSPAELSVASATSNDALRSLAGRVQWEHSYVAGGRTFCIYLASDEDAIREHARISGFPADRVLPVITMIDPTTGRA